MANLAKENALNLGIACMDRFYGQKQLLRKINKPLVEKRRRARINSSLQQLKTLVVDALNKTSSPKAKLEKADILEMTVRYIRNLQRQQYAASSSDPQVVNKYKAGFNACVSEISGLLGSIEVNPEIKSRVLDHLADSIETKESPQQKKKPEETATTEEAETSKAPLQTIQIRDDEKQKPAACKKLGLQSQEACSAPAPSPKLVISELAPATSCRVLPSTACGNASNAIYTSPKMQTKQTHKTQVPVSSSSSAHASSSSRPAPYCIPVKQNQGLSYRVAPQNMQHSNIMVYGQNIPVNGLIQHRPAVSAHVHIMVPQPAPPQPEMWRPW